MKSGILLLSITVVLSAQEGPGFGRGPGGGRGRGPAVGFTALDTDQDGVISASEIAGASAALLKLDKNGDGQITEEEIRPNFGGRGEGRGEGRGGGRGEGRGPEAEATGPTPEELLQTLMMFDKNKDGKIEKVELPERMQGMFDRGDSNKDGFLTADEIRKMAAAQPAPGGGRGEGREEGRGGGRGGPGGPGGGMMRFDPILAAIDTDHDGTLSAAEIRNAPAAVKTLDKNNDGQITSDEAMPAFGGRGRGEGRQGPPQQ